MKAGLGVLRGIRNRRAMIASSLMNHREQRAGLGKWPTADAASNDLSRTASSRLTDNKMMNGPVADCCAMAVLSALYVRSAIPNNERVVMFMQHGWQRKRPQP
jgi:hypothetical protein